MPQKNVTSHNSLLKLDYDPLNPSKSGMEFFWNTVARHLTKREAIESLESLIKYVNNLPNKDDYPKTIEVLRRDLKMMKTDVQKEPLVTGALYWQNRWI